MGAGSLLVTYGDVWNDVADVLQHSPRISVQYQIRPAQSPTFCPRAILVRTFNAVGNAAVNLWASFFRGPTDEEVNSSLSSRHIVVCVWYRLSSQILANLKRWATTRGGAVLPPLELNNQVKYVGVFPELVDQMLETQLDLHELETIWFNDPYSILDTSFQDHAHIF